MLELIDLNLRRGGKALLEGVNLRIHPGHKIGLVGANGCGKSSLFALLLGELTPDAGSVSRPAHWRVAHVAQQSPSGPRGLLDFVLDGDTELREVQRELAAAHAASDGIRAGLLHDRLQAIDGYTADSRAARLLHGLGFKAGDEQCPIERYSGGWRMRLALAQALMCRSDLLLLDEPTNHLDLDAVIWLESWLRDYAGTLLLISHDRDFLDALVTGICHIEQRQARLYSGGYSAFERQRAEQLAQQQSAYVRQQREIAHMRGFVERFRAKATKARQAQSRLKALERLVLIAPAHIDSPFRFSFPEPPQAPAPLLQLEAVSAGYQDTPVLQDINLALTAGQRLALLGPNGAGKSTLIKLLAGQLDPLRGKRSLAQGLRVGYFAQHRMDQLRPDDSALLHLRRLDPDQPEQALRDYLGGFDFRGDQATCPIRPFSGGEKARLALALIIYRRPHLLLLDEPTNHLDLEMRHALSEALQEYSGALVLVSHDRHLLRVTCDDLLLVDGGRLSPFGDGLDAYPAWLTARQAQDERAVTSVPVNSRKEQRRREATERQRLQPLRQRLRAIDDELARLSARRATLEQRLADPELYGDAAKPRLLAAIADRHQIDAAIAALEADWLRVGEALEQAATETGAA